MEDECRYINVCKNTKCCFKCFDESYLKLPTDRKKKKVVHKASVDKSSKSWETLEEEVAIKLNNIPTFTEARRSYGSGRFWWEKGDVVDDILHPECKERTGNITKQGADKTISFSKLWLTKAKEEAQAVDRIMCVPFRFKEDENVYVAMEFDDLAELVVFYKQSLQERALLEQENKILKDRLEKK